MKIGIQILAYNCESTFEKLIEPWVKLKEQYDIKIWVGSGQFKIYNDMGCENLNTLLPCCMCKIHQHLPVSLNQYHYPSSREYIYFL